MIKKPKRCSTCDKNLVRCTRQGKVDPSGDHWVCPAALVEFDPAQFNKPWVRRVHQRAEVIEGDELKGRARVERRTQPALFDQETLHAGRKPKRQFERRGLE